MLALWGCGTSLSPSPTATPAGSSPSTSLRLELEPSSVTVQILPGSALPTQAFSVRAIHANGLLTLTGKKGGAITIHAEWGGLSVSATATVFLKQPSPPSTLVPRGIDAMRIQWSGGSLSDWYQLTLKSQTFEYKETLQLTQVGRLTPDASAWRSFLDSTSGAATLSIQRFDGQKAYLP